MRRFATVSFAVALAASLAGSARAASIVANAGALVSPGVFRIDLFLQDNTRTQNVLALQFDIDVNATGQGSLASNPGFQGPNASRDDGTNSVVTPFDLSSTIDKPGGTTPIDVRLVHAANDLFNVNSLAAQAVAFPNCSGAACARQADAAAMNAIYLGSFNMNVPNGVLGNGPGFQVGLKIPVNSIFGEDDLQPQNGTDPLIQQLQAQVAGTGPLGPLQGFSQVPTGAGSIVIGGMTPEPASLALFGLAVGALGLARRRS